MLKIYNLAMHSRSLQHRESEENPVPDQIPSVLSDDDAKMQLPPFALALKEYNRNRTEGDDPAIALEKTLLLWREMWAGGAYVPHINPV